MSVSSGDRLGGALPLVLLSAMVVAALGGFFLVMEPVDKEVETGPQGLARTNPYLALERSLTALGLPTSSRYGLGTLPETDHAVVVFVTQAEAREPLVGRLDRWVSDGGHLIAVAAQPDAGFDLFDTLFSDEEPPEALAEPALEPEDEADIEDHLTVTEPIEDPLFDAFFISARTVATSASPDVYTLDPDALPPFEGGDPLIVELRRDIALESAGPVAVYAESAGGRPLGYPVVQTRWGDGRVTALSDAGGLRNAALGDHDGAALMWRLLHLDGPAPAGVVFVLTGDSPSLPALLWRAAWPALISLAVLVFALLWRSAGAFGPPLRSPAPSRRSLGEHIEAVGNWHWRHDHHSALLDELRRTARARLVARNTELGALSREDFPAAAGALTGLPAAEIRDAFAHGQRVPTRRDLTRIVATLHALAHGAGSDPRSAP
jgi:hypothetical protein